MGFHKQHLLNIGTFLIINLKGFVICSCLLLYTQTSAQNKSLDSLRSIVKRTKDIDQKLWLTHQLFNKTLDRNIELAIADAEQGLKAARQKSNKTGEVMMLTDLGLGQYIMGNINASLQLYREALDRANNLNSPDYPFTTLIYLSDYFRSVGNLDSAQYFLVKASLLYPKTSIHSKLIYHQSKGWLTYQQSKFKDAIYEAQLKIKLNPETEISAYSLLSRSYLKLELYDSAKLTLERAFSFYHDKDSLLSARYIGLLISHGELDIETSHYPEALINYEKAYSRASSLGFNLYRVSAGAKMGHFFEVVGNFPKAIELYKESIELYSKYNARQEIARINARIAWALIYSDNMVLADQFAKRSLSQMLKVPDMVGAAFAWNILGYIHEQENDHKKALLYYDSASQIRKGQENQFEYFKTQYNIAEVYEHQGKPKEALEIMKMVLNQEIQKGKNINNHIFTFNSIGRLYAKVGDRQAAESNFLKAYQFSKKNRLYPQLKTSLNNLLNFYEKENNGSSVIKYYRELVMVNDTLLTMEQNNKILQVSALSELEINKQEVEQLKSQARIDALNTSKKNQALTLYTYLIFLLLLILALVGYIAYSRKKSQNKLTEINKQLEIKVLERTDQLKLAYDELETYFYKASHDLRGPITSLIGLVELSKVAKSREEIDKINSLIEETILKQLNLVNKIQSLNSVLKAKVNDQEVNLEKEIQSILLKSTSKINAKKIQVSTDLKVKVVQTTPSLLLIIINNLINNAIDFSNNPNPKISIASERIDNNLVIYVIDNGEGIHQDISNSLYKMFFRGSVKSSGFGLGLYTVKKAAEKLGATISFESQPHSRTEFKLTLKAVGLV